MRVKQQNFIIESIRSLKVEDVPERKISKCRSQKQLYNASSNLKTYQHQVDILRQAKDTFQKQFDANNTDIKRSVATELQRIFQQLKRHVNHHRNENARILQQLTHLSQEKVNFQNFLKNIRDKLEQIERQVGQ